MEQTEHTLCSPTVLRKITDPGMSRLTGAEISSPLKQIQGLQLQPVDKGVCSCPLAEAVVQPGKYMELLQH